MKKVLDGFAKIVEILCVVIMCLMVVVVFLATLGRYTGLFSIAWSDEFARYAMIAIVYFGLMLASRTGGHFVVEIIPLVCPKPVVKMMSVVVLVSGSRNMMTLHETFGKLTAPLPANSQISER